MEKKSIKVFKQTHQRLTDLKKPYGDRIKKSVTLSEVTLDDVINAGAALLEKELGVESE